MFCLLSALRGVFFFYKHVCWSEVHSVTSPERGWMVHVGASIEMKCEVQTDVADVVRY